MFQATRATKKLLKLNKRVRAVAGGTSASKTISILLILIDYAQTHKKEVISVVSESFPHLKRGVIRDFLNIMQQHQYFVDKRWNKTDYTYTFETGTIIEFFSADQPGKVRGPRRDVLFINEANNIPYETYTQLDVRTKKIIWLDWNPTQEFWWYTDVAPVIEHDFVTLTYKDNEALDKNIVQAIEARKGNKNWWTVFGLGQLGEHEGKIYKDWQIIDELPHEARLERYGLDFGYTNDPTAIIAIYQYNGGYILDEVAYQKGLSNKQIADILNNQDKALVIADSAEPKSIDELTSHGIVIVGSDKGKDSVNNGIQYVQDQRVSMTKRSLNLIKEYRNYLWEMDKDGKIINTPSPIFNHCFVGNTKILTKRGLIDIKDVTNKDYVLTSKGFRKLIKHWDNGLKQVFNYCLQYDTGTVNIEATPEHKVKTTKGWKPISKLKSGDRIYLHKHLMEKSIFFTMGKGTFRKVVSDFIELFGDILEEIFQKINMFIIKMVIHGIIIFKILSLLTRISICRFIPKGDLKKILNGQVNSKKLELKKLRSGIRRKKVSIGTESMVGKLGKIVSTENLIVSSVERNIKQDMLEYQNTATQIVELKHCVYAGKKKKRVYDLTVDDVHEFFANGVLVHNCMDAVRYGLNSMKHETEEPMDIPDDTKLFSGGYY